MFLEGEAMIGEMVGYVWAMPPLQCHHLRSFTHVRVMHIDVLVELVV